MITIGITGGVGCGKSKILEYIQQNYNCKIILSDDVGNKVKEPGETHRKNLIIAEPEKSRQWYYHQRLML